MTITHRQKSSGSTLNASSTADSGGDDKETLKYHCDGCSNDVTNTVRIRCADSSCPDFDLCVTCFCSGVEGLKHKTWHDYRIVKPHSFPIFAEDWDADEELLLIEAAEKNGIGNWQTIAEVVGTKTKEECEQHYLDVYVASPHWPLPRMNLTFEEASEDEWREQKRIRLERSRATIPGGTTTKPAPPPPSNNNKPITSGPAYHEIQGYMPRRFEFETEYENEAEQSVKDMVFNDEDTQEEIDLKVMVLDIYNSRLDRRVERKKMIFERGWLDFKKQQALERKRQKEEREIYQKTRVFCRLQTPEDYEMFVQGLVKEQQLRDRIATLQEWRQAGLTSFRQGEQYEQEKQERLGRLKIMASLSNEKVGASSASTNQRNSYRAQMAALSSPSNGASYYKHKVANTPNYNYSAASTSTSAAASGGRKPANPLNIGEADGVHLLTEEEQIMCSTLRIMPRPYLVIKDTILKEYAKQGYMKRRQARALIKIDVNKTSRIYDFFVESGWIKAFRDPSAVSDKPAPNMSVETPTSSMQMSGMSSNGIARSAGYSGSLPASGST
ncbi:Homeodomain-like DNA binding domain-containing transcription factor [Phycomyces blakesleeanus]|uniref:Transcriptional adapter 2 n=2 Tax=Phycomyces blakesleeanus TaxID=4837 RepID=A0A167LA05_PHYB8|nr:Homeodomain-like DNA binding domain-containing transcription factor [Phycomyces blakesleeanus NRRL 1555(-)]OAD69938.1 Homeodomain-like DNA binding domain-containing transcription factor [Phycomyces blakesleeanus NRRL 1555(-)]|eukprot:XP_018287978.1 Homeodomain-like DNA binding domain-containing transcription factor [Phycomyces blakesleeanus NRRL 1555(-)]